MHRQLEQVIAELESARERLRRLAADTPDAVWTERAEPNAWSVAEYVAHLNITSRSYAPKLRTALDEARAVGGGAPPRYRRSFFGFVISATSGPVPAVGRWQFGRIKTPPAFVPSGDLPKQTLVDEFEQLQDQLVAYARESEGLPIHRAMMRSTFDPRISYNAYSALVILPRHQQRHLVQAERVNVTRSAAAAIEP